MKLKHFFVCLFFLANVAKGQKEYELKQYDKDPSAEAVVLHDDATLVLI